MPVVQGWRIAKWMSDIRWEGGNALLDDEVEAQGVADPVEKCRIQVLAHYLLYLTNRMVPASHVWDAGGPPFVAIARSFYLEQWPADEVASRLAARMTVTDGQGSFSGFTPRFPDMTFQIGRTLYFLARSETWSLQQWLEHRSWFWNGHLDPSGRIAYLAYLLSYWRARQKVPLDGVRVAVRHFQGPLGDALHDAWEKDHDEVIGGWIDDPEQRESVEHYWGRWCALEAGRRFRGSKRLWCAVRDYLRADLGHFRSGFADPAVVPPADSPALLDGLEFPDDRWTTRFAVRALGFTGAEPAPVFIRRALMEVREEHPDDDLTALSPEDWDFSFEYARRMCEAGREPDCPFAGSTALCGVASGAPTPECGLLRSALRWQVPCRPETCPIPGIDPARRLCGGC
jgi:hypothetical protein